MSAVQPVRDRGLAAHRAVVGRLTLGFLAVHVLPVLGRADDAGVEGDNGIDGSGEGKLHRASNLAGVVLLHGHHGAEHAHVEELGAHPCLRLALARARLFTRTAVEDPLTALQGTGRVARTP